MSLSTIMVGSRAIGADAPCFIAAEVGINHNGDLDLAHCLIDAAADTGADAVKFQNYRTEDFLADRELTYEYVSAGATVVESQYEMFKRYELDPGVLRELAEHCDERGVVFFSTPTSEEGIADLVAAGAPLLKNGSDFLGNLQLVAAMARSGLPTVLSTGMALVDEIADAVETFRREGGTDLALLHCTSAYPAPIEQANLRAIPALRDRFRCFVGLSDHTDGTLAATTAVALGACMIEKHFTLDRGLPGPDHRFSSDPPELRALVAAVRAVESALGDGVPGPAAVEEASRDEYRLSCVAATDLPAGTILGDADVAYRRPGTGVPPKRKADLLGREVARDVSAGHVFDPDDFR